MDLITIKQLWAIEELEEREEGPSECPKSAHFGVKAYICKYNSVLENLLH